MHSPPTLARAQSRLLIAVGIAVALGIGVACTEQALRDARPAVTALEGGLVAAGQPAAAGAVEAGFRAWEAALYLGGALATVWGARKGGKAAARAIARRRQAKAGGAPRG